MPPVAIAALTVAAKTVWAEARGEGQLGMVLVANVIRNRVDADLGGDGKPDWWGEGYDGVCLKPYQFSCWLPSDPNRAMLDKLDLVSNPLFAQALGTIYGVANGLLPDLSGGATHYFNPKVVLPTWAAAYRFIRQVGNHAFYVDPTAVIPQTGVSAPRS